MILVMSGTKDGRELINSLSSLGYDIIATTTTEYGGSLLGPQKGVEIIDHPLDVEALVEVIQHRSIQILVDATHPYAVGASESAIEAADRASISYVRYERENLEIDYGKWFDDYQAIIDYLQNRQGNVLLTIGANNLERFTKTLSLDRLYARVLPMSKIIAKCESYGLKPKNILGIQGPFSLAYNEAMIEAYDIKFMVSKATAKAGGFDLKVASARNKGIELLVLKRPSIFYPSVYSRIDAVVSHVNNKLQAPSIDRVN